MWRRLALLTALVTMGCSRATPSIDDAEASALRAVLDSAGTSLDRVAVESDLYDFVWRGAEEHAKTANLPEKAEKARKSRDDQRDTVAVEKGHVVALRLGHSRLTNLEAVAKLSHLVVVDLHDGELADATGVESLVELDHLALAGNRLTSTATIANLPKLRSVYLSDNPISGLPGMHDLPAVEILNLAGTRVSRIEGLAALPKLHVLSLERAPITRIEGLEEAPLLEELNLADCKVAHIENLAPAKQLRFLNLWHNQIQVISGLEQGSPTLLYVGLGENPYAWGDPENARVLGLVSPGRIVTVL